MTREKVTVSVEIGVAHGEPGSTWDTFEVHVEAPADAEDEEIQEKALKAAQKKLEEEPADWVAHYWVHYINWDEAEDEEEGEEKKVFLRHDGADRHDPGCDCGSCNANGKSYGVGIYEVGDDEPLVRIYRASEESAERDAILHASMNGYVVVDEEEIEDE